MLVSQISRIYIFIECLLQTDLSTRDQIEVIIGPSSDEENLQYDWTLILLKVSFMSEECYEQF